MHLAVLLSELVRAVPTGYVKFESNVRDLWKEEYRKINGQMKTADERMAIYYSRKAGHVIRLAIALQAAAGQGIVIKEEYLTSALAIIHLVELNLPMLYEEVGLERAGQDRNRVMACIRKAGGHITHSELLTKVSKYMDTKKLESVAWQLVEERKVRIVPDFAGSKLKRIYSLTEE
jgi:hypothetical protein